MNERPPNCQGKSYTFLALGTNHSGNPGVLPFFRGEYCNTYGQVGDCDTTHAFTSLSASRTKKARKSDKEERGNYLETVSLFPPDLSSRTTLRAQCAHHGAKMFQRVLVVRLLNAAVFCCGIFRLYAKKGMIESDELKGQA